MASDFCFSMREIQHLPETVRNSVRSGIILFDLTRVVEELVFNSLDAGATKVSIFINVASCYVKVVDDGSGVSRDGLTLLGQRYATSKLHNFADMNASSGGFGFRGEALASISDVSLLEIVTKARGRATAYRKVLKESKCLYLGIDDGRKDIGTTVIVRDLYYNHPVRRKYMQSSPKKVLHSIKKCILRIALVHSMVSFKVVDIESDNELITTLPCSSPMSLLMSCFGIEYPSSLHRLSVDDHVLKLVGCISGPCSSDCIKAFQYVYINSQYVCKGPIHRLLNQLPTMFECLDPWKAVNRSQRGKRSRPQTYPFYILNLVCPRSLYDLCFEPSKTYVEFKDWSPILAFIQKVVQHLWRDIYYRESSRHLVDMLGEDEILKGDNLISAEEDYSDFAMKSGIQNHHPSPSSSKMFTKDHDQFRREHRKATFEAFKQDTVQLKENQAEMEFIHHTDYSLQSLDCSLAKCIPTMSRNNENIFWASDGNFFSTSNQLMESRFTESERSNNPMEGTILKSKRGNESYFSDVSFRPAEDAFDYLDLESSEDVMVGNDIKKPCLLQCSSGRSVPCDRAMFSSENFEVDRFRTSPKRVPRGEQDMSYRSAENECDCLEFREDAEVSNDAKKTRLQRCPLGRSMPFDSASEEFEFHVGGFSTTTPKRVRHGEPDVRFSSLENGFDCLAFSKDADFSNDIKKPCLQGCSSGISMPCDRALFASEEFEFHVDAFSATPNRVPHGEVVNIPECDVNNQCFELFSRRMIERDRSTHSDLLSKASIDSLRSGEYLDEENDLLYDSIANGSVQQSSYSEWSYLTSKTSFPPTPWKPERLNNIAALEWDTICCKRTNYCQLAEDEKDCTFSCDNLIKGPTYKICTKSSGSGFRDCAPSSNDICKIQQQHDRHNEVSPGYSGRNWLDLDSSSKCCGTNGKYKNQRDQLRYQDCGQNHVREKKSRSHSAPPFYKERRRFVSLHHQTFAKLENSHQSITSLDDELEHLQQSSKAHDLNSNPTVEDDLLFDPRLALRPCMKKIPDVMPAIKENLKDEKFEQSHCLPLHENFSVKEMISKEIHESINTRDKWRHGCQQTTNVKNSSASLDIHNQMKILDIASGFLHLAGDSLVPESISKNCLKNAKVLQQVDKKFIPILAGRDLAVIDQHAADERIRLEELRQKVLFGDAKTVTYLEAEQEMILPEIGYQLIHNYAEQVKYWGWICNIHSQGLNSFKENLKFLHGQPTVITLLAVPCILGVNLSDTDLLEFLKQLADTDGSSTVPPSVLRILNFKACRGAIMFGDSLLPSECSLIVEELKQTSLCFQCAHGRPTTVPLVNLEALHEQIAKLGLLDKSSDKPWHGLCMHKASFERASQRLTSARGYS